MTMIVSMIVGGIILTAFLVACSTVLKPWITRQASEISIVWHLWRLEKTMPNTYIEMSCEGLEPNDYANEAHANRIRMEIVGAVRGGLMKSNSPDLTLVADAYIAEVHHNQELEARHREQIERFRPMREDPITANARIGKELQLRRSEEERVNKKNQQRPKGRRAWVEASALASHKEKM